MTDADRDARGGAPHARLRIGLLLHDLQVPAWQWTLFQRIHDSDYARIRLVVLVEKPAHANGQSARDRAGVAAPLRAVVEYATDLLESRVTLEPNAFALRDASALLHAVPTIRAAPAGAEDTGGLGPAARSEIGAHDLDVVINLAEVPLHGPTLPPARHGIWSLRHGDERAGCGNPPGFWEVFTGSPVVAASLVVTHGNHGARVVDRSLSATDRTSVLRNNNSVYWKCVSLVARRLQALHERGPDALARVSSEPAETTDANAPRMRWPTASELARNIARMGSRGVKGKIEDRLYLEQWILLFHLGETPCMQMDRFRKILPPKDRYWADPMVLERGGRYYIFIEEVPFSTNKGHISVIVMDEDGRYEAPVRVLERPYHLSYPFVFEHDGETYMVPESADNRTVELYRCVQFPLQWELTRNLLENVVAVDATLLCHDGRWWLFANMVDSPAGSTWDDLFLFHSDTLLDGTWSPHPLNPIVSDVTKARPAGPLYRHGGKLYRPSQDCSVRYGYGIRLQEITRLTTKDYAEKEAGAIMPAWDESIVGVHTLAHAGRLTVVDALQPRRKI